MLVSISSQIIDPYLLSGQQHYNGLTRWKSIRISESNIFGYIKEGSTVSVMGVVQRNENVLMIVPPSEPFSTGCQWAKYVLPANLDGIVLRCEDTSKIDVIPV